MSDFSEREYTTLSGGEKQLVQTARVLARIWEMPAGASSLLMLDEPTAGLDLSHRFVALRIANDFAEKGTAVFAILHDLNLAAAYADHVIILCRGKITAMGAPDEVLRPENIENVFQVSAKIIRDEDSSTSYIVTSPVNNPVNIKREY